jgi:photosynthetic reaction center H subunit
MSSGFSIDLVEIIFTLFWLFFIGLVLYLHREGKREGYPLHTERSRNLTMEGFPGIPPAKEYRLPHGGTQMAPRDEAPELDVPGTPAAKTPGSPLIPDGDPIGANIGTGAYANRSDTPDLTLDGKPRVVPMRTNSSLSVDSRDPDPRGMPVFAADGVEVGKVSDAWIDLAEPQIYFLEVATGERSVMLPYHFADIDKKKSEIRVDVLYSKQFLNAPALKSPDQITLLEEDKITGYFAGGLLYADDKRAEPFL